MKIDAPRIKSWVERLEALLEERAALNGDIRDIFTEIKKGDHDAKAIRKLIQRRAQDPSELAKQDDLLAAYTDAVAAKIKALEAIERGASTKEAAKVGGISTGAVSSLARDARVHNSRELNGEERSDRQSAPCDGEASAASNTASASSSPPIDAPFEVVGGSMEPLTDDELDRLKVENDALTIPAHLRRERAA